MPKRWWIFKTARHMNLGSLRLFYFLATELHNSWASAQGKTTLPCVKYRQPCEKSPWKYMDLGTWLYTNLTSPDSWRISTCVSHIVIGCCCIKYSSISTLTPFPCWRCEGLGRLHNKFMGRIYRSDGWAVRALSCSFRIPGFSSQRPRGGSCH